MICRVGLVELSSKLHLGGLHLKSEAGLVFHINNGSSGLRDVVVVPREDLEGDGLLV